MGLTEAQDMVLEFHREFDIETYHNPTLPSATTCELRARLIDEEAREFRVASEAGDYTEMVDAIADLIYVSLGAALALGIDIEPVFKEVHRSNMSKVGGHKRADGKWVKPDTYSPAEIGYEIRRQFKYKQAAVIRADDLASEEVGSVS